MAIHATPKPVKAYDGSSEIYLWDHVIDFYNTQVYNSLRNLNDEELDEFFQFMTQYADLLVKVHGDCVRDIKGFVVNKNRKYTDEVLDTKYQEWLDKQ
jgi:hypothetical protein